MMTPTFNCPGCGEASFPDEVGVVTCDECGAHIETLEPLGLRQVMANYWTRLRGSVAPPIPPDETTLIRSPRLLPGPGMTDLMVTPEAIDEFLEKHPPEVEGA